MVFFQRVRKSFGESRGRLELANDMHSSRMFPQPHMKEVSMRRSNSFRSITLILGFFFATASRAQSQTDEIVPLPTALSPEQLQSLTQLTPPPTPKPPPLPVRPRLPS